MCEVFSKKLSHLQMLRFIGNLPAYTVAIEACARAHVTARQLDQRGHVVTMIWPPFFRPSVMHLSTSSPLNDRHAEMHHAVRPEK
ncbi:hypothetical protein D3C78_1045170 [compost metagenome]